VQVGLWRRVRGMQNQLFEVALGIAESGGAKLVHGSGGIVPLRAA
jgi:hypothetical protein